MAPVASEGVSQRPAVIRTGGSDVRRQEGEIPAKIRVLLISDVPLLRELGAGRVQLESAEEMRRLGHAVTTYDSREAFAGSPAAFGRVRPLAFSIRVRNYIRRHRGEFDVIDALQACAPFTKCELDFEGLLVTRSTGLHPLYHAYAAYERQRWPDRIPGTRAGQLLQRWNRYRIVSAGRNGYRTADLIRVLNDDEREFLSTLDGVQARVVQVPEGLPDAHLDALRDAQVEPRSRQTGRQVVVWGRGASEGGGGLAGDRGPCSRARPRNRVRVSRDGCPRGRRPPGA